MPWLFRQAQQDEQHRFGQSERFHMSLHAMSCDAIMRGLVANVNTFRTLVSGWQGLAMLKECRTFLKLLDDILEPINE